MSLIRSFQGLLLVSAFLPGALVLAISQIKVSSTEVQAKPSARIFNLQTRPVLAQQKSSEVLGKWRSCADLAARNFKSYPELRDWILKSWINCGRRAALSQKETTVLEPLLRTISQNTSLFLSAGDPRRLQQELNLLLKMKNQNGSFVVLEKTDERFWDWLLSESFVEPATKAQVWLLWSESLQKKGEIVGALEFVERSLAQVDTTAAKERRRALELLLRKDKISDSSPRVIVDVLAEDDFEIRFRESEEKQDWVGLMQDLQDYLKKYPSGKRASWAQEKARSLLVRFGPEEHEDSPQARIREKLLDRAKKMDPVLLAEWSRFFHRRADYKVSLRLSSWALAFYETSGTAAELLWICGRSAQFIGSYRQSRTCFETVIQAHKGSSYYHESLFRLGLVYYRQKQWSSARAQFEALLVESASRYELNSRYWLVRTGQKLNSRELIERHSAVILQRFPLSYYGLRLRLEQNSEGLLKNVTPEVQPDSVTGEFTWTPRERQQLQKVGLLARNGWETEALQVLETVTWPRTLENKIVLIPQLSQLGLFFPVIRLTNEVTDLDSRYRTADLLQWSYPKVYADLIANEAKVRMIHPALVKSLIRQESGFRADVSSSSDARGLMQMIPPTGLEVAADLGAREVVIPDDLSRPPINIQFGSYYLSQMLSRFSRNVPAALAAYNAGPTRVDLFFKARAELKEALVSPNSSPDQEIWFDEVPWSETSFYIKAILRNSFLYQLLDEKTGPEGKDREVKLPALLWSNLVLPAES